ncbi:MAG: phosphate ABC transporter permease subunit PstC [Treponema sp.]|jgi:phosphate transport system permease protein|nr:phosphate ABC transporter permease subunit PstC [Treponema sp.]
MRGLKNSIWKNTFFVSSLVSIVSVLLIIIFMAANGVPAMIKIGFAEFLLGQKWKPEINLFGIFPMIAGSLVVTLGAIILGVPLGIFASVFLTRYIPNKYYKSYKFAINLLAGIPSVVFGFIGLTTIVPFIRSIAGGSGTSILSASIVLAVMILPTIINVSENSLRQLPPHYFAGSLALGATKERSIFALEIKAAKSGIISGVILGIGRAIGETMAVIMVAGNQAILPRGIFKGVRTMTANIVLEMGYASGLHREALIATSVILFIFILIINSIFLVLKNKKKA